MENFYELVRTKIPNINRLDSAVKQLYSSLVQANLDSMDYIKLLFDTAEYVDNEFYKKLGEGMRRAGRADRTLYFGHMISVLHLRSYDEHLPEKFERMWQEKLDTLSLDYKDHPIYKTAREIVDIVMPEFSTAFQEDPDKAYPVMWILVNQFAHEMQESRLLL